MLGSTACMYSGAGASGVAMIGLFLHVRVAFKNQREEAQRTGTFLMNLRFGICGILKRKTYEYHFCILRLRSKTMCRHICTVLIYKYIVTPHLMRQPEVQSVGLQAINMTSRTV
jgi:hypothetical protein